MATKHIPAARNNAAKPVNHSKGTDSAEPPHKAAPVDIGSWRINSCQAVRTISANELTSLSALIAYAAYKSGASEFRIERDLADRFNIANVKCLPAARFDDAMRYLVDRVPTQSA